VAVKAGSGEGEVSGAMKHAMLVPVMSDTISRSVQKQTEQCFQRTFTKIRKTVRKINNLSSIHVR
jgi:hypothetical protein